MEYTKGEWRASPVRKSGATISIQIGVGSCDWGIGDFSRVLPNNRQDSQVEATHIANANLIVKAVNACISINPDNPIAVADSIKGMYEALKLTNSFMAALEKQDPKLFNDYRVVMLKTTIEQALAEAGGKE